MARDLKKSTQFRDLIVEKFDFFGQNPDLRILDKKKYTSGLGCCMTFLIGTATLAYLITQIMILYQKSQPRLVYSQKQIFDSSEFPLKNDNFTFAITVTTPQAIPIKGQNKYYNITVNHCLRQRIYNETLNNTQINVNCTQIPMDTCQESDFDNDLQKNFFKNTKLGVVQCINREYLKTNPPILQGQLYGTQYQFLVILMQVCQNSSTYQGCAPLEEQKKVLSLGQYGVYTSEYLMQLNNPEIPYQQLINAEFNTFSISSSKFLDWSYRIQETHTDDGIFLSNDKVTLNLQKQSVQLQSDIYNSQYLIQHVIRLDYIASINERSYIKIQTILSQVGGLWQVFIVILSTILRPLINGLMTIQMANELFRFKIHQKEKQKNLVTIKDDQSGADFILETHLNDKKETLSNNFFQSFLLLIGCYKEKKKLLEIANLEIMKKLDIVQIIEKLQEIDLLKFILLSNEQLHLFDLLPKPMIELENQHQQLVLSEDNINQEQISSFRVVSSQKSLKRNVKDYLNSFELVSKQLTRANVNDKLLQLMNKNVMILFEQYQTAKGKNWEELKNFCPLSLSENILEPVVQKPK